MTPKKIAVIHQQPLELFPPAVNFLDFLDQSRPDRELVLVLTTGTELNDQLYSNKHATIKRLYTNRRNVGFLARLAKFSSFITKAFLDLIKFKPDVIVYFESHSALPVFLYQIFRRNMKLFIHYHEYMTPAEYSQKGMRFVKLAHSKERLLYKFAQWISHTNQERVNFFLKDHPEVDPSICHVLPNYPPLKWSGSHCPATGPEVLKLVYVGSFGSLEHLFIEEVLVWVKSLNGKVTLDIYSYNVSDEVNSLLSSLNAQNITLNGSIDYNKLPHVLRKYDVGLIFYKATSLNVKYCAPNKLFEYLACDLDVWFSKEMTGCYPYIRDLL